MFRYGLTPISLNKLRHVVVLAEERNYLRAAASLNLSQPALSRSIQSLEEEYSLVIFDRDRSGVHLTPAGRDLVARAFPLLSEAGALSAYLRDLSTGEQGRLSFGLGPLPAAALLPQVGKALLASHSGLQVAVSIRNTAALQEMLLSDRIEFFLAAEASLDHGPPISTSSFGDATVSLFVRPGHPLLDSRHANEQAASFPLVSGGFPLQGIDPSVLPGQGYPSLMTDDHAALLKITRETDAVWLAAHIAVREFLERGEIREVPNIAPIQMATPRLVIATLERRTLSPGARIVIDLLRRTYRALASHVREPPT